jgi:hypothetical protein
LLQEPHNADNCNNANPHVAPGLAQAAILDPLLHDALPPDEAAADNLRRLAIRFLRHPDSQVDMVRMEPGAAGRFKVVISLETADFF